MAWNESFSHDGGWGAGETSFATSGPKKDSASSRTADKLNVPVTISDLVDGASPDEKYVMGDYAFGNVLTIGVVRSFQETDATISYVIYDPANESKEYSAIHFFGIEGKENSRPLVEGTRVQVTGKLRHLSDDYGIMAFDIREVENDQEYKAFTLEAKISKIYFTKNVSSLLQNGRADCLKGTCAGAPAPKEGSSSTSYNPQGSNFVNSQQPRIYNNTPAPAQTSSHSGIAGQRGKILEVLETGRDSYGENGMSIDEIKQKIGSMNIGQLRGDLDFLVSEGHIYATINDDNFALIG